MRIGLCTCMLAGPGDPLGANWISAAARAGYDFLELPVAPLMELSNDDFARLHARVEGSGLPCECCNVFFPGSLRLTGPDVDKARVEKYLQASTRRVKALGAEVVVFGSAGAKNVPEGFPPEKAQEQLADMLLRAAEYCESLDLRIAIEPLNSGEANIILTLAEGEGLMRRAASPRIRLLADYYHFALERDSTEDLSRLAPEIIHTHFAVPEGRGFPTEAKPEYAAFFEALRDGGYNCRCSLEAVSAAPETDIERGLAVLREIVAPYF